MEEAESLEELDLIPELESAEDEPEGRPRAGKDIPHEKPEKKSRRLPTLLRLTRRATVFLSLTLTATSIFFVTGNRQTFLDSNLALILSIISYNSIALLFFSALAIVECVFYLIRDRRLKLAFHLVCYVIALALSIAFSLASLTINLLSEGISF